MSSWALAALQAAAADDALGRLPMRVQASAMALTVLTAVWAAARRGRLPVLAFAVCAVFSNRANHRLEGPLLLYITREHGLVTADLLPVALTVMIVLRRRARGRVTRVRAAAPPRRAHRAGTPARLAPRMPEQRQARLVPRMPETASPERTTGARPR